MLKQQQMWQNPIGQKWPGHHCEQREATQIDALLKLSSEVLSAFPMTANCISLPWQNPTLKEDS